MRAYHVCTRDMCTRDMCTWDMCTQHEQSARARGQAAGSAAAYRADDKHRPVPRIAEGRRDRLHGLAQAHLISDQRPAAVPQRKLHALALEGEERVGELGWQRTGEDL